MKIAVAVAVTVLSAVACGPPIEPRPTANTAPAGAPADPITRGHYVGAEVGIATAHFGHAGSRQRLPDGLETLSAINVADGWHFTVARRGDDLVILLIDSAGVVVDDVAMRGRADDTVIVGDCADSFIGVAPPRACETAENASAALGWDREGQTLVRGRPQTCSCALLQLD